MANEKELRDLICLIHECSAGVDQWGHFLVHFAAAVDASAVPMYLQDVSRPAPAGVAASVTATYGIDPFWARRYAEYYCGLNVWTARARHRFKPGYMLAGESAIPDAELVKTEFYADFLRPQNQFYSLTSVLTGGDSPAAFLVALRPRSRGPFERAERALTRELVPHLRTALRVHHRIAGLEARLNDASAALDRLPHCLIVTDASGRILNMNRQAEALLKSERGLSAAPDGLRAGPAPQTARLREFIARTAATVNGQGRQPGGVLEILRAGRSPLKLIVAPLAPVSSARADRRPAVAIFISEPEQPVELDPRLLGALLDLSPTEARLTAALAAGRTVQQFAEETGVSPNTARTLLKRIFSKTGVSRQADLVRLALTRSGGPGWA